MTPYYQDKLCTIYHGDCLEIIPRLLNIDVVFTSPPYLNQRSYNLDKFDWYLVVPKSLSSIVDNGKTQIFINLGQIHKNGEVVPYWNYLIEEMRSNGWRWFDQYVWDKLVELPGHWSGHLACCHEYIFHFNKSTVLPNKWIKKSTHTCGSGLKNKDGKTVRRQTFCDDTNKIANSVIRVSNHSDYNSGHPAVFPEKLVKTFLRSWNGIVLDPFMGSGTVLSVAKNLSIKSIGIDINEKYCEIAAKRLSQEVLNF